MDIYLRLPKLALCSDRDRFPKYNVNSGSPEDWFSIQRLKKFGLFPINFDFFVNWSAVPPKVTRNIWIKSILNSEIDSLLCDDGSVNESLIFNLLTNLYGVDFLKVTSSFAFVNVLHLEFLIFRDVDWYSNPNEKIIFSRALNHADSLSFKSKVIGLEELMGKITLGSGGEVYVGKKGLIYGTSTLECYLSNTPSAYPGDADMVLVDIKTSKPRCILEFKKHNLSSSVEEQKVSNYYPRPDKRKYDRLAVLRDFFVEDLALVNVYYPTLDSHYQTKVEIISGGIGSIKSCKEAMINLPSISSEDSMDLYVKEFVWLLEEYFRS